MKKKLARLLSNVVPINVICQIADLLECYRTGVKRHNDKIKLRMYDRCNNFGDQLNKDLMNYLNLDFIIAPRTVANVICIGSILDGITLEKKERPYRSSSPISVFGTGFKYGDDIKGKGFIKEVNIYSLRGELSKSKCERILQMALTDIPLGDPGLLTRRMFPSVNTPKRYDVGIVCHMHDKGSSSLKNIRLANSSITYIDIQESTATFVNKLSECNFILSSAMHGLIAADSLGIPNKHIILSDNVEGNGFKFRDYYSVFPNYQYSPVDVRSSIITDKSIRQYRHQYTIRIEEVNEICDRLERAAKKMKEDFQDAKRL